MKLTGKQFEEGREDYEFLQDHFMDALDDTLEHIKNASEEEEESDVDDLTTYMSALHAVDRIAGLLGLPTIEWGE